MNKLRVLSLAVAICGVQAAHAQSLPDRVRSCASQSNAATRLQCYDQLASSLDRSGATAATADPATSASVIQGASTLGAGSAQASRSPGGAPAASPDAAGTVGSASAGATTAAAAVNPPSPESQFGIAGGKLQRKKEAATPKEIQAVVAGVARRPRGELVITLDNGQVWVQLEPQAYYPLAAGETVHISKGMLGSYVLTTAAKRGSKVTRIL